MGLAPLALKYRCDKMIRHSYIPAYQDLLTGMQVKSMLEIGIGYPDLMAPFVKGYITGASLYMWRDYFPDAVIHACDIKEEVLIQEDRIKSFWCDQSSEESLRNLMKQTGMLDFIVDDGSHITAHQILTCRVLRPALRKGGLYVIEDVQAPEKVAQEVGGTWIRLNRQIDDNLIVVRQ